MTSPVTSTPETGSESKPPPAASTLFASFAERGANTAVEILLLAFALGLAVVPVLDLLGVGEAEGVVMPVLLVLFFAVSWASPMRATPCQRLGRIAVVDLDGRRLRPWRALLRSFALLALLAGALSIGQTLREPLAWLVAVPAWLGLAMAAVTPRRQALHDLLLGTVVVRRKALAAFADDATLAPALRTGVPLFPRPPWRGVLGLLRDGVVLVVPIALIHTVSSVAHHRNLIARVHYAIEETQTLRDALVQHHAQTGRFPDDVTELGFTSRTDYPDGGYYAYEGDEQIVIRFTELPQLKPIILTLTPRVDGESISWDCRATGFERPAQVPPHCRP